MKLDDEIPRELDQKRVENAALQKLLSEPLDFPALNDESSRLETEVRDLQRRVQERQKPSNDGDSIEMMRQHVKLATLKKSDTMDELRALQQENNGLVVQLRGIEAQIDQFRDQKVLSGDEFRKYSNQVRSKTATTKNLKQKLADMHAEWGVLSYTRNKLDEDFRALKSEIEKIEDATGMRGYSDKAENLNRVTAEKDAVEDVKGRTLEELSRIVQDIMVTIRDRRSKLNPQITELRSQRQAAAEVDQQWEEYKAQYELQEGLLMQDVTKIESEVNTLDDENRLNEALYHRLNHQKSMLGAMKTRADDERGFRGGGSSLDLAGCKTYTDFLERSIASVEGRSKELQHRRRDIDDNHDTNIQQVEWFNHLRTILEVKLKTAKQTATAASQQGMGGGAGGGIDRDIVSVMNPGARGGGGVDMLVLGEN